MRCGCWGLGSDTYRDGDAGLGILTALLTVHTIAEGADAGGEGREGQIVVVPLTKQGHKVTELAVADDPFILCAEDVVGHLSHLKAEERAVFNPERGHMRINQVRDLLGRTSGSKKLLIVWLLKPLGWEMPSS